MPEFSIIMAYMDGKNSFRRRNLFAVIDRCLSLFPEETIVVAEQGKSSVSEKLDTYNPRLIHVTVEDGKRFHKTKLLNTAVEEAPGNYIVMVDADTYLDDVAAKSIYDSVERLKNEVPLKTALIYPFDSVDYLTEGQTRDLLAGNPVNSKFCDHGVHIQRQTGLCNIFEKSCWKAVRGFDEDFYEWGAEDDAFAYKLKRKIGQIVRVPGHVYHLFHQKVDNEKYVQSPVYLNNRKMCACIRRMSGEDFDNYVDGHVGMAELIEKYDKMRRLSVRIAWPCTPKAVLTIDSTIYDLGPEDELSITKLLETVMAEDGPGYMPFFVREIFGPIKDLSDSQKEEIRVFLARAAKLAEETKD